jgi:hypothetical protein
VGLERNSPVLKKIIQWLFDLQIDIEEEWMLVGDFNFYRSSEDRNRGGGNYNDMEIFLLYH